MFRPLQSGSPYPADYARPSGRPLKEVERELRNMALSAGDAGLARAIEKMEATLKEMHEDIMEIRCKVDDNHTKTQQQVRRLSYKLNAPIDEVDAKAQEIAMGVRNLAPKYHKVALEMHSTELMEMPGSDLNTADAKALIQTWMDNLAFAEQLENQQQPQLQQKRQRSNRDANEKVKTFCDQMLPRHSLGKHNESCATCSEGAKKARAARSERERSKSG